MKKKGFTLVELMVVVAIIAILAAVALPMYTRFKQKALASGPVKVTGGLTAALQAHFDEFGSFATIAIAGGKLTHTNNALAETWDVGASVPELEDVTWVGPVITGGDPDQLTITWTWAGTKCPAAICNGEYCLRCANTAGTGCDYVIRLDAPDLGLNKFTDVTFTDC